jgi:hypothetical protein
MKLIGRSKLDAMYLTKIFALADIDQDQRLNPEEFAIAMYMTQCKLNGEELPGTALYVGF